jgi:hypothetical protein
MMKKYFIYILFLSLIVLSACMDDSKRPKEIFNTHNGVLLVCNGNFMSGNSSLTYYSSDSMITEQNVFFRANSIPLGDVAQSVCIHNNIAWVVVNNSGKIFAINPLNFEVLGKIDSLLSPRYFHPINDVKAYVSDLYAKRIWIVDLVDFSLTGSIDISAEAGGFNRHCAEQMVQWGDYIFTNCWNYDNKILVIDTKNDALVDSITVGIQPQKIIADINGRIWVLCDGSYAGSPIGYENPSIWCIDSETRSILWHQSINTEAINFDLALNQSADTLFVLARDLYSMPVEASVFPQQVLIDGSAHNFSVLGVHPVSGDIYLADAVNYVQSGQVYRFDKFLTPIDTFSCGIIPVDFAFMY